MARADKEFQQADVHHQDLAKANKDFQQADVHHMMMVDVDQRLKLG